MTGRNSVTRRLVHGVTWVGTIGGLIMIALVAFDFDLILERTSPAMPWRAEILEIIRYVVLPLIALLVPMYWASHYVIRRALAPLGAAADRIDAAKGVERGFRLDLTDMPLEVLPFATGINELLGRLDDIAERREAFAAEIAHELKTPLAILMLGLDQIPGEDAVKLQADVAAMSRLLDQLLMMARLDAHATAPVGREAISLSDLAESVVARLAPLAIRQDRQLALETIGHGAVHGRREALAAALRNLIENALRVTPPGGRVTVFVGPGKLVRVRDGGSGLSAENLARFVQPFQRGDRSDANGAGLGLAIAARIMAAHCGSLHTDPDNREMQLSFSTRAVEAVGLIAAAVRSPSARAFSDQ